MDFNSMGDGIGTGSRSEYNIKVLRIFFKDSRLSQTLELESGKNEKSIKKKVGMCTN